MELWKYRGIMTPVGPLQVLLVATALFGGALAQQQYSRDPQTAAILTDARYLSGDGTFGAAYTQEDGVQFKEETDAEGNRRGAYSYVDPTGVRRTVSYTAGKNGFQVSEHGTTSKYLPRYTIRDTSLLVGLI